MTSEVGCECVTHYTTELPDIPFDTRVLEECIAPKRVNITCQYNDIKCWIQTVTQITTLNLLLPEPLSTFPENFIKIRL